jgi:hypothetical protein
LPSETCAIDDLLVAHTASRYHWRRCRFCFLSNGSFWSFGQERVSEITVGIAEVQFTIEIAPDQHRTLWPWRFA